MFHCVQKCNLIFSPVETYLNPQRSSCRPPSWIFIRNILFILPPGAEWMEWRSVQAGIGIGKIIPYKANQNFETSDPVS